MKDLRQADQTKLEEEAKKSRELLSEIKSTNKQLLEITELLKTVIEQLKELNQ